MPSNHCRLLLVGKDLIRDVVPVGGFGERDEIGELINR
jgi:hypothetical protein